MLQHCPRLKTFSLSVEGSRSEDKMGSLPKQCVNSTELRDVELQGLPIAAATVLLASLPISHMDRLRVDGSLELEIKISLVYQVILQIGLFRSRKGLLWIAPNVHQHRPQYVGRPHEHPVRSAPLIYCIVRGAGRWGRTLVGLGSGRGNGWREGHPSTGLQSRLDLSRRQSVHSPRKPQI